jgi:hypothetical protein
MTNWPFVMVPPQPLDVSPLPSTPQTRVMLLVGSRWSTAHQQHPAHVGRPGQRRDVRRVRDDRDERRIHHGRNRRHPNAGAGPVPRWVFVRRLREERGIGPWPG